MKIVSESTFCLYPISRGNNWGFGGKTPFKDNCIVLDLSMLNRVSEYEESFGTIRITPGVSQGDLSEYLKNKNSKFYLDVTGSGTETSVLGNTLERGIAYNSLRVDSLQSLEVLLPNGVVINTGFSGYLNCDVKNLYQHGIGPELKGLFLQSNLGIVLSATIKLKKRQEKVVSFRISIAETKVGSLIEVISSLLSDGVIDCIAHIGDPLRIRSTKEPILQNSKDFSDNDLKLVLKKLQLIDSESPIWSCLGNIQGPKGLVRAKQKIIKKRMSHIGKVQFYDEDTICLVTTYLNWGPFKNTIKFLRATESLRGLINGNATSEAVKMLFWSPKKKNIVPYKDNGDIDVDKSPSGCIFCVPLTTMNKKGADKLINHFRSFSSKHGLLMGATLNTLNANVLEAVISFHFDPSTEEIQNIHKLFIEFNQELIRDGLFP